MLPFRITYSLFGCECSSSTLIMQDLNEKILNKLKKMHG